MLNSNKASHRASKKHNSLFLSLVIFLLLLPYMMGVDTLNSKNNTTDGSKMAETSIFSLLEGFYDEPIVLKLSTKSGNAELRYTLDGSIPIGKSPLYVKPLKLKKTTVVRSRNFTVTSFRCI